MGVEDQKDEIEMVKGFMLHCYHTLKSEFRWCMAYKLVPAGTFLWGNLLMKNTLDCLIKCQFGQPSNSDWSFVHNDDEGNGKCIEGSSRWIWVMAFFYVVNHGIAFTVDTSIGDLQLGEKAMRSLRTDIFAVMLQFTPESNEKFPTGKVMKMMENQTEAAVRLTWLNLFTLFEKTFTFAVVTFWLIYLALEEGGELDHFPATFRCVFR
mmetsp:Transcript_61390/g.168545  ORF Transcript_61390/g.168545 Transcript_61390/m.168545 type:complete len:208 (-) Transcript_61390:39-662(-)